MINEFHINLVVFVGCLNTASVFIKCFSFLPRKISINLINSFAIFFRTFVFQHWDMFGQNGHVVSLTSTFTKGWLRYGFTVFVFTVHDWINIHRCISSLSAGMAIKVGFAVKLFGKFSRCAPIYLFELGLQCINLPYPLIVKSLTLRKFAVSIFLMIIIFMSKLVLDMFFVIFEIFVKLIPKVFIQTIPWIVTWVGLVVLVKVWVFSAHITLLDLDRGCEISALCLALLVLD